MRATPPFALTAIVVLTSGRMFSSGIHDGVDLVRVPHGGIQPEIAVDAGGVVHMVYLAGEPAAANVFYVRSTDNGKIFSSPVRVNNQDGSAIATGTIRGAQIAIGRSGRVHVAWNGSNKALPKPPLNGRTSPAGSPMLYARANKAGTAFEPQRNLIRRTTHRDMYSLVSGDHGRTFAGERLHGWKIGACPMTSASIAVGRRVLRAWETDGQVYFNSTDADDPPKAPPLTSPSESARRKHPRLAVNSDGTLLIVWTEGTSWGRGGSLAWQAFGIDGRPTAISGGQPGVPVWSFTAVVARRDGGFRIFY